MENISKDFTWKRFLKTNHKVDNTPTPAQKDAIIELVTKVLQPLRDLVGVPVIVSSGFRSAALNVLVGGSNTSQHSANNGAAADLQCPSKSNVAIFNIIKDKLTFDQLIWEFGTNTEPSWVHVSYKTTNNRKQILKATKNAAGKTVYTNM